MENRKRFWLLSIICLLLSVAACGGRTSAPPSGNSHVTSMLVAMQKKALHRGPLPSRVRTLLDVAGSAGMKTNEFTVVHMAWGTIWSYRCPRSHRRDQSPDFTLSLVNVGADSPSGVLVKAVRNMNSGIRYEYTAGRYYFSVASDCPWRVRVLG